MIDFQILEIFASAEPDFLLKVGRAIARAQREEDVLLLRERLDVARKNETPYVAVGFSLCVDWLAEQPL